MATDIDLEKVDPGKMFGGADNAKDYTFFLFRTDAGITPKDLESKGAGGVPQKSLIFSSPVMPDEKNRALVDLKDHAKKIKGILSEAKTPAIAAVLATARPGNENPNAKVAVFQPVTLHCKPQKLKLNVLKGSAGKEDWVTYHHSILYVELVAKDIPQITWELNPKTKWFQSPIMMTGIWEQAQPGTNQIGGKMLVGCVGDNHAATPKCTLSPAHHGSAWWPLWSTQINNQHAPQTLKLSPGVSNYVMGLYPRFPGSYTLTVTGTGPLKDQKATVNLSSSGTPTGD